MGVRLVLFVPSFLTSDRGVTAIEYGLIAALVAVAIIGAMSMVGQEVQNTFDIWTNAVRNAVQGAGS
jgi:pilus assembly protein Flp/PilA